MMDLDAHIRQLVLEREEDLNIEAYLGSSWKGGHLYHAIPVDGVTAHKNTNRDIERVIADEAFIRDGRVLELGCHAGAHTLKLAEVSEHVIACDTDHHAVGIAQLLLDKFDVQNVEVYCSPASPAFVEHAGHADVCVFLNTHKWIVKAHGEEEARRVMQAIYCDVLYFQCPELGDDTADYLRSLGYRAICLGTDQGDHDEVRYLYRGERE